MISARAVPTTLAARLWPVSGESSIWRAVVLALFGSLLLTVSAKVQVPFWPVPMTMQTFVVLVLGAVYGWRLGSAAVLAYLVEGAAGLPVFAGTPEKGIGIAYMMGPTGGYLIGFVAAAAFVGYLIQTGWGRGWVSLTVVMLLGHAVIFAFGLGWIAPAVGWSRAVTVGLAPFWMATILKTALAVVLVAGLDFATRREPS